MNTDIESNINKIALGSVQFGLDYGISNKFGKTSLQEVQRMLEYALSIGINTIDTANLYGDSEINLGKSDIRKWNVVSKFPSVPTKQINMYLSESLERLNLNFLYGYIAHNADDLIESPKLWEKLLELKESGKVSKVGYSLYKPSQLEQLLKLDIQADLVQLPFNLLDRRFKSYFEELKSNNTEIHTRSTFLQGLFFIPSNSLEDYFNPLKDILGRIEKSFDHPDELAAFLLKFCMEETCIDKVVIGVNSLNQLESNILQLKATKCNTGLFDDHIKEQNIPEEVLLPFNWPKS